MLGKTVGETTGETIDKTAGRATSRTAGRVASRATCGAASGADDGVGTIEVWIDIIIILTNVLIYVPKLKKQSKQIGSSSFCSCLTDII